VTAANCEKHPFELAENPCYDCGYDACKACLVFARGPKKPAICLECSITAAGVRQTSARPPKYIGKDMKVLRKRLVKELKERRASSSRLVDVEELPPYDPAEDFSSNPPPPEPPFEPIAEPAFVPIDEPAFESIVEPSFEPVGELSIDERIAPGLTPTSAASDEQMPTMDWSQDFSEGWNATPALSADN
jgi:hypothetical protein